MSYFIHQSKRLAYLLRHSSLPDMQGWIQVSDLIARHGFTTEMLKDIVYNDESGRFEFSGDKSAVRTKYGHTNHVYIEMPAVVPPRRLYHGTSDKAAGKILSEGIARMNRHYVHLSETVAKAIKVGERHGTPVVLTIDTEAMYRDGHKFHNPTAGVWLTSHIDACYISIEPTVDIANKESVTDKPQ